MNKLNLYMRAVVITALLVVAGLGIYKGRTLLKGEASKTEEKTPESASSNTTNPAPQFAFGSSNNTTTGASETAPAATSEKPSLMSKFKFGSSNTTAANMNDAPPAAPEIASSPAAGVNDYAPPANEYAAAPSAPIATNDTNYGDNYATPAPVTASDYNAASPTSLSDAPAMPSENAPPVAPVTDTYNSAPSDPPTNNANLAVPATELQNAAPLANATPLESTPLAAPAASLATAANNVPTSTAYEPTAPVREPGVLVPQPSANNTPAPYNPPQNILATPVASTPATPLPRYADEVTADTGLPANPLPVAPVAEMTPITVDPQLQGPQSPSIVLEKFAPPEVQVGKPALFEIQVNNVGKVPAHDVIVVDEIPPGTRYLSAKPEPSQKQGNKLVWKIGSMKPGEETVIELQLIPEAEGEIGSVAQVSFQAQVGSKSLVTKPRLEMKFSAPEKIHVGETAVIALTLSNQGTGAANNVLLETDVPPGFTHPAGQQLEFQIGTLRPGESKQIELNLRAEKAGQYQQALVVRDEADAIVQDVARIEIIAPNLQVDVQGPKKRFVERQATHTLTITNPGTAPAKQIDLMAYLPAGFKFISADHEGEYDARQHAVLWGLDELPPNTSGSVQLTTLPIEAGDQRIRIEGRGAGGLSTQTEQLINVEATSELPFTVADLADPIEVGSENVYEVHLHNQGTKDATNVRLIATFPVDMKPLAGDGATKATLNGQQIEFAPIAQFSPGNEAVFKIQAQGLRAGDHRIAITVTSDESPTPVTREESTRVYADQ